MGFFSTVFIRVIVCKKRHDVTKDGLAFDCKEE